MDSNPPRKKASFTIWELLAVLFIVLILYFLVYPAIMGPRESFPQARSDESQLANAIKQFYTDYGYYPCAKNPGDDSHDFFENGGTNMSELIDILRDNNQAPLAILSDSNPIFVRAVTARAPDFAAVNKLNSRQVIYLDEPYVKDPSHPKSGIGPDGAWYDPWGHPYLVKIDSNYNGTILNPYDANAGPKKLTTGVIVWSLGSDGKGATLSTGNGDKNAGYNSDDVTSWQ